MTNLDPSLLIFVIICFSALAVAIVLRFFRMPSVISYIVAGMIIGPYGFDLIKDQDMITTLGNFGVVLLLFFVGMEVSIKDMISRWKVSVLGTVMQIFISVAIVFLLGRWLGWPIGRIVLLGFVISLSSTAVVIKILESKKEIQSRMGQDVLGILIVQDIAIIPMIVILGLLGGNGIDYKEISLQVIGGILAIASMIWVLRKKNVRLPFGSKFKDDPELQVLAAFILCFGIALLSGFFHLSAALGAFMAGVFLAHAKETEWVHKSLSSFKVIFLALFFISIGMLINIEFFFSNIWLILIVLFLIFLTNTLINVFIFRWHGRSWCESFYGGSLLSQVGEFSFILAAIGVQAGLILDFPYQITISVIALSLIVSPMWIGIFSRIKRCNI